MGVPPLFLDPVIKNTPIYKWLKNKRIEKKSLHDIRLTFPASSIWILFRKSQLYSINQSNLDISLPDSKFLQYANIDVKITIHHTDTVSVAIGCSSGPLAIEGEDILLLFEYLTRIENHITEMKNICTNIVNRKVSLKTNSNQPEIINVHVPNFKTWICKMWHFGVDTLDEYNSKEFHVSFEEGIGDLYRIYTKRKNGKRIVRVEHQEYPNVDVKTAILKKMITDGILPWNRS